MLLIQAQQTIPELLKEMLLSLSFAKPPDGITVFILFSKIEGKVSCIFLSIKSSYESL